MAEFQVRADAVDVEQIMRQIRARIREKRGADYTEQEIRELASVKLEKFLDPRAQYCDAALLFGFLLQGNQAFFFTLCVCNGYGALQVLAQESFLRVHFRHHPELGSGGGLCVLVLRDGALHQGRRSVQADGGQEQADTSKTNMGHGYPLNHTVGVNPLIVT